MANPVSPCGMARTGVVVKCFFSSWKLLSQGSVHAYLWSLRVRAVKGLAIQENPSTNLRWYLPNPRKPLTSITFFGCYQLMTASIVAGSTATPPLEAVCPRKITLSIQNSHFLNLAYSFFVWNRCNTDRRCLACSSLFLEYTKMSSMKTITNLWKSSNTRFIKFVKAAGALGRPNGITKNS